MKKNLSCLVLILLMLVVFTGCSPKFKGDPIQSDNPTGTTQGNITVFGGHAIEHDGFIYFIETDNLYEYDPVTGKTVRLPMNVPTEFMGLHGLQVHGEKIYLNSGSAVYTVQFDGKKLEKLLDFHTSSLISRFYIEYPYAYHHRPLRRLNMEDGSVVNISNLEVESYYVAEDTIYVIGGEKMEEPLKLYAFDKQNFKRREIDLPFEPLRVYEHDGILYIAQVGTLIDGKYFFNMYCCTKQADGTLKTERIEGINTTMYQFCGDALIYLDSNSFKDQQFDLCTYHLGTKEISTHAHASEFFVINDSTIFFRDSSFTYYLLHLETGKTVEIPIPGREEN